MKLSKFIGDKKFYKTVLIVALPIMIQNGITNFVNLLDNIMVGKIGTEQMSGVAIVNQIIFVVNLCLFGAMSGAGIFTAQFYGKGDEDGQRQSFRFKIIIGLIIGLVAMAILTLFGDFLIKSFLNDGSKEGDLQKTFEFGKDYLWVAMFCLVPFALAQAYGSNLRETGETFAPMMAGFVAVIVNLIGNYLLIFGKFGCPKLGVQGAAIASLMSRFFELGYLVVYCHIKKQKHPFIKGAIGKLFKIDKGLSVAIFKKCIPLMLNETLWALGVSLLAQCYSRKGLAVVAGYNISTTVINVFNIAYMALGNAVGIILGKYLGAGELEEAIDTDRKLIAFSLVLGVAMGGIVFSLAGLFPRIYNTTLEVKGFAEYFIQITALAMPIQSYLHSTYFTIRSGGKVLLTFFFDCGFMWLISVPLAFILVNFTQVSIYVLFAVCTFIDIAKCVIGFFCLKHKIWVNKLV